MRLDSAALVETVARGIQVLKTGHKPPQAMAESTQGASRPPRVSAISRRRTDGATSCRAGITPAEDTRLTAHYYPITKALAVLANSNKGARF
jgi:hypothetical protein